MENKRPICLKSRCWMVCTFQAGVCEEFCWMQNPLVASRKGAEVCAGNNWSFSFGAMVLQTSVPCTKLIWWLHSFKWLFGGSLFSNFKSQQWCLDYTNDSQERRSGIQKVSGKQQVFWSKKLPEAAAKARQSKVCFGICSSFWNCTKYDFHIRLFQTAQTVCTLMTSKGGAPL